MAMLWKPRGWPIFPVVLSMHRYDGDFCRWYLCFDRALMKPAVQMQDVTETLVKLQNSRGCKNSWIEREQWHAILCNAMHVNSVPVFTVGLKSQTLEVITAIILGRAHPPVSTRPGLPIGREVPKHAMDGVHNARMGEHGKNAYYLMLGAIRLSLSLYCVSLYLCTSLVSFLSLLSLSLSLSIFLILMYLVQYTKTFSRHFCHHLAVDVESTNAVRIMDNFTLYNAVY
jgi:hypothetical protein